jgi:hypothetical protein
MDPGQASRIRLRSKSRLALPYICRFAHATDSRQARSTPTVEGKRLLRPPGSALTSCSVAARMFPSTVGQTRMPRDSWSSKFSSDHLTVNGGTPDQPGRRRIYDDVLVRVRTTVSLVKTIN